MMIKSFLSLGLVLTFSSIFSQKISYTVSFPNILHHEARIQMDVAGTALPVLTFRMSRSSPGRYATHEFGKNVYDITATDASGKALPVIRTDGDIWQVSGYRGTVKLSYTLYGNYADGTYDGIDAASIHLNMPATFMWVKGMDEVPITVQFIVPDSSFTIATQLKPGADKTTFSAPGLQYLMDSPTKIGKLQWRQWPVNNGTKAMTMRLALEADATAAQADSLADIIKRITQQAKAVFGEYPAYDYDTYTFLASINPYVYGDGMEHRNSTMITTGRRFSLQPRSVGVFAHEFFHCWNVERIRPKTLEPFNFEKSNMSNELWCAEGFTQYYGQLLMVRAGLVQDTFYATNDLSGLIQSKLNTPGAQQYTVIQSSNEAVFTDAGISIDKTNYPNITTSYYNYGGAIALALDLTLRKQGKTLDQFMQQMWKVHGKPEKSYTVADMQAALAAITNAGFAKDFFDKYVYAPGNPDYAPLLEQAGFTLQKLAPGKAWLGARLLNNDKEGVTIASNTSPGTPAYDAGLDVGDTLLTMDNKSNLSDISISRILSTHKPGDQLSVTYKHRGEIKEAVVIPVENPYSYVATYESLGRPVTDAMRVFRKSWMGAKSVPQ